MLNKQRKYMPEYVPELLKIKTEQKRVWTSRLPSSYSCILAIFYFYIVLNYNVMVKRVWLQQLKVTVLQFLIPYLNGGFFSKGKGSMDL